MTSAREIIERLESTARVATLAALDEITRPLTVRDLDRALAGVLPRSQRRPVMRALLGAFDIIAMEPKV